ncbi:MAG: hypothetical protein US50_C0056G0006 [Candidatus Nomurabacteria bacterium GW2011_GWB1_37_5]|uniref:YibE/F family protein n=1 Tax=Candidatus Nomurabacteria bacterium GW2011_GWB1_37_5 TaxID=1618742 RepID=A0A0G0GT53_9BACT|nr:MAG: hypothetical protein US50_C0056G0006 [Candidatus Nomurabacteria bacterium GW2011_GWB1_37_5]
MEALHVHTNENDSGWKPNKYIAAFILAVSILAVFLAISKSPNKDIIKGEVKQIKAERIVDSLAGMKVKEQDLSVNVTIDGEKKEIAITNDFTPVMAGDKIFLQSSLFAGEEAFEIKDISREKGVFVLTALFIILVFATSGWRGFYSLIGLVFSLSVILVFIVPLILKGLNPIFVGIAGSFLILLVTLYLSHGLTKKSISAFIGIILSLLFTGILANLAVQVMRFTGFSNEGALYLNMETGSSFNLVGLLTAGIIIAAIGILDDVAVTQSSTVFSLASANSSLKRMPLYKKAMSVGKDHISAVINTLVLAYTGAALPLVLLLTLRNTPIDYFLSFEMVSEEIVRTLVASSGLLLAVPITTAIAVFLCKYEQKKSKLLVN